MVLPERLFVDGDRAPIERFSLGVAGEKTVSKCKVVLYGGSFLGLGAKFGGHDT